MKKIYLLLGLFLCFIVNVDAKNNMIVAKCFGKGVTFDYVDGTTNTVYAHDEEGTYYVWNEEKCQYATTKDMLNLYNKSYSSDVVVTEDGVLTETITKYKYAVMIGYIKNTKAYDKDTTYYEHNTKEDYFSVVENVKAKNVKSYYLEVKLKHIESDVLSNDVVYYLDKGHGIYEEINASDIKKDDLLNVFVIFEEDYPIDSTKDYTIKVDELNKIKDIDYKDDKDASVSTVVLAGTMYAYVTNDKTTKYYTLDGDIIKNLNDKTVSSAENKIIAYTNDKKKLYVLDENMDVLKYLEFDEETTLVDAYVHSHYMYLNLATDKDKYSIYTTIEEESNYVVYIIMVGIIAATCISSVILSKKN